MIIVTTDFDDFAYDIHSLVKAFFPGRDVKVHFCPEREDRETEDLCPEQTDDTEIRIGFCREAGKGIISSLYAGADGTRCSFADGNPLACGDRGARKDLLKQVLYRLLRRVTGQDLPWGSLTGIRPAKIPMKLLEEGKSDDQIRAYMRNTYFTSDEKISLCLDVAKKEGQILKDLDARGGHSLYVGIPFCPTTCAYCSFTSYPLAKWADRVDAYLDALEKEIRFVGGLGKARPMGDHLDTVYIGGGTPTTLTPGQMDRLLSMLDRHLDLSTVREFTVEAGRPDSITADKLSVLKDHGISRISINPQTMQQKTLDLIGRRHTVDQTRESFSLARDLGFDNINMDLIVGLPEEDIGDVQSTMEEIGRLSPDNVTVHSLAIKRAARLRTQQEDFAGMQMVNTWETIALTADHCRRMGLAPYYMYRQKNMAGNFENVGYAREGLEGLYNILIMEEKQTIMALGAGAITKFVSWPETGADPRIVRVENVKDVSHYLDRVDEMIERKQRKLEEEGWR